MSAVAPAAPTGLARADTGRIGFPGAVRSEWTKLVTVRSTVWALGILVVLSIGIGALVCAVTAADYAHMSLVERATYDPTARSLSGTILGQLAIGVLGALIVTSEYGTGSIRATLTAVPRRPWVLLAKALVFGVVALVISEVTAFVAFVVGQAILSGHAPTASLSQSAALRAVVFDGLYLMLIGLLALGIGFLLRHTAGAITAFVVILLVLPGIISALPNSIEFAIQRYMPETIGGVMASVRQPTHTFSAVPSLLLLILYVVVVLGVATVLLVRRDA